MPNDTDPNLVDRFAELVAAPSDREAAVLTSLTVIGAHLGRSSTLVYDNRQIYPTLYSLIIGDQAKASWWREHLSLLPNSPPVQLSGLYSTEALAHLVRDEVWRPDRVYTERGQDPCWTMTCVDDGSSDKRLVIMQRMGPYLTCKTAAPRRLVETLHAAYLHGKLSAYVGYRDGGFHGTNSAHIALLISEPDEQVAAKISDRLPFLIASAKGPAIAWGDNTDLIDLLSDILRTINPPPPNVTVGPSCAGVLDGLAQSRGSQAVTTVLRVAHVLSVLALSPVITEALLDRAISVVNASNLIRSRLQKCESTKLENDILEFVGITGRRQRREITRHFRGRGGSAEVDAALSKLETTGVLGCEIVKTRGRPREDWEIRA